MNPNKDARLHRLLQAGQQHLLRNGLKGLEKESLRLAPDGTLAQSPHPATLGSALTHPWITTDYSEALIELITPPFPEIGDTLDFLADVHAFVYENLGEELLLATSMPIGIAGDDTIPIARYGTSNIGWMKHVYRRGLAYRYGRAMQAIAGVHFNYSANEALWPVLRELEGARASLPEFIANGYFGAVRNVHRYGWLVVYLFGSSPAISKAFFTGREPLAAAFPEFDAETLHRPYATSLRMSDIGYRNDSQASLEISCNNLDDYVASLSAAIDKPYPPYEQLGVKVDGEYRQLNANILQIENEYYSAIRPKQVARSCEKPTVALKRRGVRYLELRVLDLMCFEPLGVGSRDLRFLETFLLYCLLADSPPLDGGERGEAARNSLRVACCGRTPGFCLARNGREVLLRDWASELLERLVAVAELLDGDDPERPYQRSVERHRDAVADADATPSARMLDEMRSNRETFAEYALRLSRGHAAVLRERRPAPARAEEFLRQAEASREEQRHTEASDTLSFDDFLKRYFAEGCTN